MIFAGLPGLRIGLIGPLPPPSGGMANQTRQLAELLAGAGAIVTTVQVNAAYKPRWIGHVPVLRSLFRLAPYLMSLWHAAGTADIFHVMANSGWSWHLFAAPAIWIGHLRGVAVVVNYRGGEAGEFLARSHRLVHFTVRRARALVVPSGFLQNVFFRFGMESQIVPNIIDLDRFHPREPGCSASPHLLVARNLELLYDNETAIRAFEIVRTRFSQARLTIAGSGPDEQRLQLLVGQRGLSESVHFVGRQEREAMASLYRSADLMLNPSLADNMPNSVLESWASGVPVVTTNVGGIPYLAQHGINAALVPPGDPSAMAGACVQLLSDHVAWQRLARAGLQEARRYTWTCVQPILTNVYCHAIEVTKQI